MYTTLYSRRSGARGFHEKNWIEAQKRGSKQGGRVEKK